MWIMLQAYTSKLPPHMLWNFDGTLFIYDPSKTNLVWDVCDGQASKKPFSVVQEDALALGIKYLHMGSAGGGVAPMVLMVAASELKENEYHAFRVPGLAHSVSTVDGWLVFCKTRIGNMAFFQWFLRTIAIPTVTSARSFYQYTVSAALSLICCAADHVQ